MGTNRRAPAADVENADGDPCARRRTPLQIKLREEVFEFLANRIRTNVRRLEGALIRGRVVRFAERQVELNQRRRRAFAQDISPGRSAGSAVTIDQISGGWRTFRFAPADMHEQAPAGEQRLPRPNRDVSRAELTKASLNGIGDAFGGAITARVLHACKLVKRRMLEQDNIRQTISFNRQRAAALGRQLPRHSRLRLPKKNVSLTS